MAAGEDLGPFGQVYGGWEPALWPLRVWPSQFWAWAAATRPTTDAVRWPAALAAVAAGFILARRAYAALGWRSGLLFGVCYFGSLAAIDRTSTTGIDWISGLAVVAALDRLLTRGADWWAGLWIAAALLAGGWPPVAMILLPIIVMGRPRARLSVPLLLPVVAAFAGWSAWALRLAPAGAWAAAFALPLTEKPAWTLALAVLALGMPWIPFTAFLAHRDLREAWTDDGRRFVIGWLQVAGVALLAGTVVPGMASSATLPALLGGAVGAAAALDRLIAAPVSTTLRRAFLGVCLAIVLVWAAIVLPAGGYLAAAVSYYRPISVVLIVLAILTALLATNACWRGNPRWAFAAVLAVACWIKVVHWGIYVPEWNYRLGQGVWGRAIGQWVLPNWPVNTFHTWSEDLAFATGHPIRQLPDPLVLTVQKHTRPVYVLLTASEFEHWPADAPRLIKVRALEDERGEERVIAHTEGDLGLRRAADSE
jgi:hypothetical protein